MGLCYNPRVPLDPRRITGVPRQFTTPFAALPVIVLAVLGSVGGCKQGAQPGTARAGGGAGGGGGVGPGSGGSGSGGLGGSAGNTVVQTCVPPADKALPAAKLSQTGCVDPSDPKKLAISVIPYEVNSPLWSDGANKLRGMALPSGGKIHVKNCTANPSDCPGTRDRTDEGRWLLPVGTVLVKSFLFDGKYVETRLLVQFNPKTWVGYSYKWDEAQTDATLVWEERDQVLFATGQRAVQWYFPSRRDCDQCHVEGAGYALGTETAQFNRVVDGMNQIDRLTALGAFDAPVPKPYRAALVAPYPSEAGSPPPTATTEQRAASYLHANCAFCHRPAADIDCTAEPCLDLRLGLALGEMNLCDVVPAKNDLGIVGAKNLVPGKPEQSLTWVRMTRPADDDDGKHGRMPLLASYVVDQMGVDLIGNWIKSISACP